MAAVFPWISPLSTPLTKAIYLRIAKLVVIRLNLVVVEYIVLELLPTRTVKLVAIRLNHLARNLRGRQGRGYDREYAGREQ